ncbi:hypothetical protein HDU84_002000 [Entophlyctis sp. JEL0112]|nr:hypothetical protein HDU84_002000 [Entophlyctis sp. JEL0112]
MPPTPLPPGALALGFAMRPRSWIPSAFASAVGGARATSSSSSSSSSTARAPLLRHHRPTRSPLLPRVPVLAGASLESALLSSFFSLHAPVSRVSGPSAYPSTPFHSDRNNDEYVHEDILKSQPMTLWRSANSFFQDRDYGSSKKDLEEDIVQNFFHIPDSAEPRAIPEKVVSVVGFAASCLSSAMPFATAKGVFETSVLLDGSPMVATPRQAPPVLHLINIKKIRRKKMNKHKLKKLRRSVRNSTRYNKKKRRGVVREKQD